jgi:multidrug resistance protein, MATE family
VQNAANALKLGRSTPRPWRDEFRATAMLAAPLAVANLLQMAIYAVDVVFVARLGEASLAASSLAVSVFGSMMWGFHGLAGGAAPLIGAELGRARHAVREVRRSVRMALWYAALCGIVGLGVCVMAEPLMLATGQNPAISAMAGKFILLLSASIIPAIAAGVLRVFVAALGRPVFATAITALAIAVNALGNWLFVFGNWGFPALGLSGSALSTLITSLATVLAYVLAIRNDRRLRRYHIFGRWWRSDWQRFGDIGRIGGPIALTVIAEGSMFNSAAFIIGRIGTLELAAHTIALQIVALFFQIPFGIGQAATIRVAYHMGAGNPAAVGRAGWSAIVFCIVFQIAAACVMLFAPQLPIAIYLDPEAAANRALVAVAVQLLLVGAAFQLFDGLQTVAAGVLRGLQDTRMPMVFAIAGYWLGGFTAALWLGLATPLGAVGVWIGLMVGVVLVSMLLLRRWHRRDHLGLVSNKKRFSGTP